MLTIKLPRKSGEKDDLMSAKGVQQTDFQEAAALLAPLVAPAPKTGTSMYKLLSVLALTAITDTGETYTEIDVAFAYDRLYKKAQANMAQTEQDREFCLKLMEEKQNKQRAAILKGEQHKQLSKSADLDKLESAEWIYIGRGTGPTQARNIMTHGTFGGLAPNPDRTEAPTDKDADKQTGYGEKGTSKGVIEEWSLGTLDGFATDGFMLLGVTKPAYVTLPPKGKRGGGEQGVCGYADRLLEGVAIGDVGREGLDMPPLQRELDAIIKADHRTNASLEALRASTARRVM
ncbi:hypothetical protein [Nocardia sp. NPDC052566]|uniref:hypothetical protein n=1 Tax=Nocardia sp. NPDC052566 TaxID=3364330 RepID=UPI0037C6DDFF